MLFDTITISEGGEVVNATIASGTAFPSNANAAELFFRTDNPNGGLYVYDGSQWMLVGSGGTVDLDGLNVKAAVRAATTANVTLSGLQTIDGVTLSTNDRVLVKNQLTSSQNGIYVASSSAWARSSDFDGSPATEVKAGDFVFVTEGTTNGDTGWVLTTNGTITIGTTSLTFSQFTGANAVPGGANTQLQFNNNGSFGGAVGATYNSGAQEVTFVNLPKHDSVKLGYLTIPRVTTFNTAAVGKRAVITAGITVNASTFAAGDAVSLYNDSDSDVTISAGVGMTLRLDGTTAVGNRTLFGRGSCFIWFNSATEAIVSGSVS